MKHRVEYKSGSIFPFPLSVFSCRLFLPTLSTILCSLIFTIFPRFSFRLLFFIFFSFHLTLLPPHLFPRGPHFVSSTIVSGGCSKLPQRAARPPNVLWRIFS